MGAVCVGSEEKKEGVEKEERKVGLKRRKGKRRVWERWKGRERKEKGGGREKKEKEGEEEREEKGKDKWKGGGILDWCMNKGLTRQKFNCIIEYLCSHCLRSTIWYCSRSPPSIVATISSSVDSSLTTSPCREDVAKS